MRGRVAGALLVAAALGGAVQAQDQVSTDPPSTVAVAGRTLQLTGTAVQTRFWFPVYTVSLYLVPAPGGVEEGLAAGQPKALRLTLLRNATRSQLASALEDGMRRAGVDLDRLKPRLDQLLAAIPDMRAGETLEIDSLPGEGALLHDQRGRSLFIAGTDFADALFNIWLGDAPRMARIRRGLLGERPAQARRSVPSRP